MSAIETLFIGTLGAAIYGTMEFVWRGRTHWTMLILGGVCFLLMYLISTRSSWTPLQKWLSSAAIITLLEFITGVIVNIRLGWNVWDYSGLPLNLCGQICIIYSIFWFLLSIPGTALCTAIKNQIFQ